MASLRYAALLAASVAAADTHLRSLQQYSPSWSDPFVSAGTNHVAAMPGASPFVSTQWACRCLFGGGQAVAGGRATWNIMSCTVVQNNSAVTCTSSQLLLRDPTHAWVRSGSAVAVGAVPVSAGIFDGAAQMSCRARNPNRPTDTTVYAGTSNDLSACNIVVSGSIVRVTAETSLLGFELLYSLPPTGPADQWTAEGVTPLNPTPSATPSPSPTSSASAPAVLYGTVGTYEPPLQPGTTRNERGYRGGFFGSIPALWAGTEQDGKQIYACVGFLPNGQAIAGKYSLGAGWSWCDIPHDESEENDNSYVFIRDLPWLVWHAGTAVPVNPSASPSSMAVNGTLVTAAPSSSMSMPVPQVTQPPMLPGAALAVVGIYNGNATIPCRAWMSTGFNTFTGPHVGTYSFVNGVPLCSYGFGARVIRSTAFDLLWVLQDGSTRDSASVISAATAVPRPSASPTPSITPTTSPSTTPATAGVPVWLSIAESTAAGFMTDGTSLVASGQDGMDYSRWPWRPNMLYTCRAVLRTGVIVPGRYSAAFAACEVAWNASEIEGARYDVLIRSPFLAWAPPEGHLVPAPSSTPVANRTGASGSPIASGNGTVAIFGMVALVYPSGSDVVATGRISNRVAQVCRAFHPGAPGTGPFVGYTLARLLGETTREDGTWADSRIQTCTFSYNGEQFSVTPYDVLVSLPGPTTAAQWNRGGATQLAAPSPSPSPSPSPTGSPSPAPPAPGTLEWRYRARANIGPMLAGVENRDNMFVCRGYIPGTTPGSTDIVPGKWHSNFNFCDIPVRGRELNDIDYDLLRSNPLLTWVPHNSTGGVPGVAQSWPGAISYQSFMARGVPNVVPTGATLVMGGQFDGLPAAVCRAMHTDGSGPHPGYTDGELYGSTPLCFYSWGGRVIRTTPFDYLYMYPVPSPSPSPISASPSPTSSTTRSGSPTPSRTPSMTPSNTGSSSGTPSRTPTSSMTPTSSNTPTPTPTGTSSKYPSGTPTPSRTPISATPTRTGSATPLPSRGPNGSRLAIPSPSASVAQGAGQGTAAPSGSAAPPAAPSTGGGGMSAMGVTALIVIGGIAAVCVLGAMRKKQTAAATGTAVAGATGEGDRVRIVTAAA